MKNAIEILYNESLRNTSTHKPDSVYIKMFTIQRENMRMLNDSMTQEQKDLLDAYATANAKTEGILLLENFRYAFHLGAQLMSELLQDKEGQPE